MFEATLVLDDKRIFSYAQYGDPLGLPVFYFHGGQESRLSAKFLDSPSKELNIRLIVPERPGIGFSSFQKNRTFQFWALDIIQLAESLSIEQFYVIGLSGGAPHVLALLQEYPQRVIKASIVSGAAPPDAPDSFKGMWFPVKLIHWFAKRKSKFLLHRFLENDLKELKERPGKKVEQFQKYLPKPDRELLISHPEYAYDFIEGSLESYRQGIEAVAQEFILYVSPWDFDLKSCLTETDLWYGTEDKMAPVSRGMFYKSVLKNSKLHILENEAHFSLIRNHSLAILGSLIDSIGK